MNSKEMKVLERELNRCQEVFDTAYFANCTTDYLDRAHAQLSFLLGLVTEFGLKYTVENIPKKLSTKEYTTIRYTLYKN